MQIVTLIVLFINAEPQVSAYIRAFFITTAGKFLMFSLPAFSLAKYVKLMFSAIVKFQQVFALHHIFFSQLQFSLTPTWSSLMNFYSFYFQM